MRARGEAGTSSRGVWTAILLAVLAVVVVRGFISLRGYLYADDFAFRYWAATQPLDPSYLLQSYGGHVNPVGLLNQWVLQAVFPGSHTALAVFTLMLWTVTLILAARLAMLFTGRWQAAVLLVLLLGMSLFSFENTTWWAAAIYAGPYQLFLVAGLYLMSSSILTGNRRRAWLAVACAAGASLSFSRGFMAALLIFGVAAAVSFTSAGPAGVRAAWRAHRRIWITMAVISAVGLAVVLASSAGIARPGFSVLKLPAYMWNLAIYNVFPAVWGGPWRWFEIPPEQWEPIVTNPAPAWWAVWLFLGLTLAGSAWVWLKRPLLRHLLIATVTFACVVLVIAGLARSGTAVESMAYRYTFDIVWPVALLMVLAVVPMRWQDTSVSGAGAAIIGLVLASAVLSTVVPARDWMGNQARQYMANASATFGLIPADQAVLNQGVPHDLIHPGLMAPYANAEVVMTPQPGSPAFAGVIHGEMWGFAEDGHAERQDIAGPTSMPGTDPECGYRVTDVPRTIRLDGQLIDWAFYARVAYFTGVQTTLNLAVGGQIHTVPLQAGGLHAVYFPVTGPGEEVLVSVGTPGVTACVTEIRIGNRVSADSGEAVPLPVTHLP